MRENGTNSKLYSLKRIGMWVVFFTLIYFVVIIKVLNIINHADGVFLVFYSFIVSSYIISRFVISHFYVTDNKVDLDYEPTITFGVPAKNEEDVIAKTIMRIADMNYPREKIEIICVNDGSDDNTLKQMKKAQSKAARLGVKVVVTNWKVNRGKREGMAYCARMAKNEIIVFIDSDSLVDKEAARELVKFMSDRRVGAVTGHTFVQNDTVNMLTKMQSVRYFIAFRAYKSSEAIFGTVTCCSGPCTAYRLEYLLDVVDDWLHQKFLNIQCTYGDDRSLTNSMLEKGYKTLYSPGAKVYTFVPENLKQYLKQQLRWKKSWIRECLRASLFIWKKNPIMSLSFYTGLVLPFITPYIIIRAFIIYPMTTNRLPYYYFVGVFLMTLIMGLYYMIYTQDRKWFMAVLLSTFYSIIFFWQLPYAIITIRDSSWGTR